MRYIHKILKMVKSFVQVINNKIKNSKRSFSKRQTHWWRASLPLVPSTIRSC